MAARWTVVDGDQELVIEATEPGLMSIDIPRPPFVTNAAHLKDLRAKLSLAIGVAQAGQSESDEDGPHDGGIAASHGGE